MSATPKRWSSFVALGDSFTEGLDDPRPDGGFAGWADRVAEVLARDEPDFRYANLAIRSLGLGQVVDRQVPAAVEMRPDLVSIAAGGNDVLRLRSDLAPLGRSFDRAVAALAATGATVVVFTGYEPGPGLPLRAALAARVATYNEAIRAAAERHGGVLVDLWSMDALADRRMWSRDRLHLSARGHVLVAGAVLTALGVRPPFAWPDPEAPAPPPSRLASRRADLVWGYEYFLPWVGRRLRGRTAGDAVTAKRPTLTALRTLEATESEPGPIASDPAGRGAE